MSDDTRLDSAEEEKAEAAELEVGRLREALEEVEWIMVCGRVQCPACLSEKDEGHGALCLTDEALRPTPQKAYWRAEQERLYAALAAPQQKAGEQ